MMERIRHGRILMGIMPGRLGRGIPVQVTELSLQGISLETSSPLRPGASHIFRLNEGGTSSLEARVVWCRLDRNERSADGRALAVYRAGLSRLETSAAEQVEQVGPCFERLSGGSSKASQLAAGYIGSVLTVVRSRETLEA